MFSFESLLPQLRKIDHADLQFYILAEQILDLCKKAPTLFSEGNSDIKLQLLNIAAGTFSLSSGTLLNTTKKPFLMVEKGYICKLVGEEKFELSASCSQSRRRNFAEYRLIG